MGTGATSSTTQFMRPPSARSGCISTLAAPCSQIVGAARLALAQRSRCDFSSTRTGRCSTQSGDATQVPSGLGSNALITVRVPQYRQGSGRACKMESTSLEGWSCDSIGSTCSSVVQCSRCNCTSTACRRRSATLRDHLGHPTAAEGHARNMQPLHDQHCIFPDMLRPHMLQPSWGEVCSRRSYPDTAPPQPPQGQQPSRGQHSGQERQDHGTG